MPLTQPGGAALGHADRVHDLGDEAPVSRPAALGFANEAAEAPCRLVAPRHQALAQGDEGLQPDRRARNAVQGRHEALRAAVFLDDLAAPAVQLVRLRETAS